MDEYDNNLDIDSTTTFTTSTKLSVIAIVIFAYKIVNYAENLTWPKQAAWYWYVLGMVIAYMWIQLLMEVFMNKEAGDL